MNKLPLYLGVAGLPVKPTKLDICQFAQPSLFTEESHFSCITLNIYTCHCFLFNELLLNNCLHLPMKRFARDGC